MSKFVAPETRELADSHPEPRPRPVRESIKIGGFKQADLADLRQPPGLEDDLLQISIIQPVEPAEKESSPAHTGQQLIQRRSLHSIQTFNPALFAGLRPGLPDCRLGANGPPLPMALHPHFAPMLQSKTYSSQYPIQSKRACPKSPPSSCVLPPSEQRVPSRVLTDSLDLFNCVKPSPSGAGVGDCKPSTSGGGGGTGDYTPRPSGGSIGDYTPRPSASIGDCKPNPPQTAKTVPQPAQESRQLASPFKASHNDQNRRVNSTRQQPIFFKTAAKAELQGTTFGEQAPSLVLRDKIFTPSFKQLEQTPCVKPSSPLAGQSSPRAVLRTQRSEFVPSQVKAQREEEQFSYFKKAAPRQSANPTPAHLQRNSVGKEFQRASLRKDIKVICERQRRSQLASWLDRDKVRIPSSLRLNLERVSDYSRCKRG